MRKVVSAALSVAICLIIALYGDFYVANANSAQTFWVGKTATGAIVTDGDCPIEVEKETLVFALDEFPKKYYRTTEEFAEYGGKFSAEYVFFNPSDITARAKALFPFGPSPSYAAFGETYDDAESISQKYGVFIDGKAAETRVRYTLFNGWSFNESDVYEVIDGFIDDDFWKTDLNVTVYRFEINGVDKDAYPAATIAFDLPRNLSDARLWYPDQNGIKVLSKDSVRISSFVEKNGYQFEVFAFGDPLEVFPEWKCYKNGGVKQGERIDGEASLIGTRSMLFKEYALSNRPTDSLVSEFDWYNALVAELNESYDANASPMVYERGHSEGFRGRLNRWFEYEIEIGAKERLTNVVSTPIYPSIDLNYHSPVFEYSYLLSPAKTWKSFGELEIIVDTPFFMVGSEIEGFEKIEGGYALKTQGLPKGELTFSLSAAENPIRLKRKTYYSAFFVAATFVLALALLGGTAALIIVAVKRRKNRSKKK